MPKYEFDHHVPRNFNKKKHHKKGFNEDAEQTRYTRVSFKNYIRELDESFLEAELNEIEGRPLTDEDKKFIIEDFKEWCGGSSPEECGDDQLQDYAYDQAPKDLDEQDVLSFLRNYTGE